MINRGKRNVYAELFTKAFICAAIFYFTVALIGGMAKNQIIATWEIAKGFF